MPDHDYPIDENFSELLPLDDTTGGTEDDGAEPMPSKTYKISWDDKHISGLIDGFDAAAQAIEKRLATEGGVYDIYSPEYGMKTQDLIGMDRPVVQSEIARRIEDALSEDDRISAISDLSVVGSGDAVTVRFTAETIFDADISATREVTL